MLCELYLNQKKKKKSPWTLLVTQWIRICLPMQGTQVWSLVQEDSTCCRAGKPIRQNYWARVLVPSSHSYPRPHAATTEAHAPRTCAPAKSRPCSAQLEKASAKLRRPSRAKLKKKIKKKNWVPLEETSSCPTCSPQEEEGWGMVQQWHVATWVTNWWKPGILHPFCCSSPMFYLGVRKIPWRKKWQPTPVFLPRKSQGQKSLTGYSPWGHRGSDTTDCKMDWPHIRP